LMLEKIKSKSGIRYQGETLRRIAIRAGIGIIAVLILLSYIEIRKEAIVAACYEKNLYRATAPGRWLKYGQYEPDTIYQKTIDKIPFLHYARISGIKAENVKSETGELQDDSFSLPDQKTDKDIENTGGLQSQNTGIQSKGSLLVRYAYGTIQPMKEETVRQEGVEQQNGTVMEQIGRQGKDLSTILSTVKEQYRWKDVAEQARFLKNYYIADVSVGNVSSVINGEKLLSLDTSLERISEEPQILVYHTHVTEGYKDSRDGVEADTVVGMGDILCEELTARGFSVLHDRTTYDYVDGKDNRDYAYTTARPQIEALLKAYPSIEVILDIHRDSGAARRTLIEGKDTAQIMLFNGLCRNASGPIKNLPNPYLDDTLAFSLQLNLLGRERHPGLMYKIYLKNYRYNMHFTGHCMLVELGTQNNTVEEAQNGIRYFAGLLYELLTENN